jgi:hypothetical protein
MWMKSRVYEAGSADTFDNRLIVHELWKALSGTFPSLTASLFPSLLEIWAGKKGQALFRRALQTKHGRNAQDEV